MIKKERETVISNENTAYIRHSEVCRAGGKKIIKLGWKGVNSQVWQLNHRNFLTDFGNFG